MTTYPLTLIAAGTFILFIVFCILLKIGGRPSPYRSLARLHLAFSVLYFISAFIWTRNHPEQTVDWQDFALGLYLYFALEYAFFAHVFATIIRGFSIGICVVLHEAHGRATLTEIQARYASGKGIDYVKNERIAVLIESGALEERSRKLALTSFGRFTARLNRCILRVWNFGYLGHEGGTVHE